MKLRCPVCERLFSEDETDSMPFCSRRCQQIDLSRWLAEERGIPVNIEEEPDEEAFEDPERN